uniref:Protein kinase domain-containing protein n=1 Tax=Castor canadensis TaxID=51338 RepID=A0A8C0ZNW5_CASCN
MGTLCPTSALHDPSTRGQQRMSDYTQTFVNREQVEEKGAKLKHELSTRGVRADIRGLWEESQKADLPEGTVERPPLITSGMRADLLIQTEASPEQGDGGPSLNQVPLGHLLLPTQVEAKAPEISSKDPRTGLESSAAPDRVSEALTSQEVAPTAGQGISSSKPDTQAPEEGMRLTSGSSPQLPGPPTLARAAHHGRETLPRISIHVQEMHTHEELLVTPGGRFRPTLPAEPPGPRDELAEQTPKEAGKLPTLQKSNSGGAEESQGPGTKSIVGQSLARRDEEDDASGAPGLQKDKGLAAEHSESGKDCAAGGSGRAKAEGRMYPGAEASSIVLDDSPAPSAPFEHRVVSAKEMSILAGYTVCQHEVLGGGRFGQVHRCTENSTGLPLAAKIIKVKSAKDREDVKNEINIMNQLSHVNLIQLYDAFESKNSFSLIMEYVDGGELFDRITDEKCHLTELDVVLFTRQICTGVLYLHQHYILHLDLKPENILCVSQTGHQIKIIDFGLARRYKPREKLKVNFGTPEFLAPEVVNYEFVSFPTDMWSVGVITYMLLSGLSPFLGETDAETMNFIVNCTWDFDADTFEGLSEEAKDFVSQLLVKEKSCRMSATQCLKHEWLNNLPAKASKSKVRLKSQLLLQKYMAQRKWKKHFYVVTAANRLRKFPTCP